MSNQQKTASSLSADSTQIRYQKALKEINKLIGVNTQLRDQVNRDQQILHEFQYKLEAKQQQLMKTLKQVNYLQMELTNATNQKTNLVHENEELKKEVYRLKNEKSTSKHTIQKVQSREYLEDEQLNGQQQHVIFELQKLLHDRDIVIKQLRKRIPSTECASEDFGYSKTLYSENIKTELSLNEMSKKLAAANDYIQRLSFQCSDLRNKLMKAQTTNQLLTCQSAKNLHANRPSISSRNQFLSPQSTNSAEVLKRYHKLEEQNKKLIKKYEHLRKETQSQSQNYEKMQKQNRKMQRQIIGYQQLIKKQQNIINDLHVNFDEEVLKMTNQFKHKLQEQRESFSPAKTADHMKTIQNLQVENKSLKKKFQLCSIELTKCFKTLEVYKTKLNQCEKDYSDLVNERQQLLQKLSKLQNTNRDRSTHSRGSVSKINIDIDRRSSMGETGYFNHN